MDIFEFNKEIDDMTEGELRATAREFREKHNSQVSEANEIEAELAEYKEALDAAEETAQEARTYFAEKASEVKDMDAEVLADRFSVGELRGMVEEAEAATVGDDVEDEPSFSEKPPKGKLGGGDNGSSASKARVAGIRGIALD